MTKFYIIVILIFQCQFGQGQEIVKIVDVNAKTNGPNETLPFDRPIILKYVTKEPIVFEYIGLIKINKDKFKEYFNNLLLTGGQFSPHDDGDYPSKQLKTQTLINASATDNKYEVNIYVPPLQPNKFYDIAILRRPSDGEAGYYLDLFQIYYDNGNVIEDRFRGKLKEINELKKPFKHIIIDGANAGQLDTQPLIDFYTTHLGSLYTQLAAAPNEAASTKLKAKIKEVIRTYKPARGEDIFIFGQSLSASTTSLSFDTRTAFAVTPDFGYVYYGFQDKFYGIAPYIGLQIEFRYFDKNVPFWLIRNKSILHYLSFTTGITLASLKREGKREDFFSGKSLLAGLGIRLSNAIRFTFGGIVFNKEDPNPYIDNKKLGITPFAGLSIDLKLKSLLNDFTGLASINRK